MVSLFVWVVIFGGLKGLSRFGFFLKKPANMDNFTGKLWTKVLSAATKNFSYPTLKIFGNFSGGQTKSRKISINIAPGIQLDFAPISGASFSIKRFSGCFTIFFWKIGRMRSGRGQNFRPDCEPPFINLPSISTFCCSMVKRHTFTSYFFENF